MERLCRSGREVVLLSFDEILAFCGNCIELKLQPSETEHTLALAISRRALRSLTKENRDKITKYLQLIEINVDFIEHVSGGGIRCMLAGNHLPDNQS